MLGRAVSSVPRGLPAMTDRPAGIPIWFQEEKSRSTGAAFLQPSPPYRAAPAIPSGDAGNRSSPETQALP